MVLIFQLSVSLFTVRNPKLAPNWNPPFPLSAGSQKIFFWVIWVMQRSYQGGNYPPGKTGHVRRVVTLWAPEATKEKNKLDTLNYMQKRSKRASKHWQILCAHYHPRQSRKNKIPPFRLPQTLFFFLNAKKWTRLWCKTQLRERRLTCPDLSRIKTGGAPSPSPSPSPLTSHSPSPSLYSLYSTLYSASASNSTSITTSRPDSSSMSSSTFSPSLPLPFHLHLHLPYTFT